MKRKWFVPVIVGCTATLLVASTVYLTTHSGTSADGRHVRALTERMMW